MKREEFEQRFPNLTKCLWAMGLDNEMKMKDELIDIDSEARPGELVYHEDMAYNPEELEALASTLEDDELETLVAGEVSDMEALVARKGLEKLGSFLDEAFDGFLADRIYEKSY